MPSGCKCTHSATPYPDATGDAVCARSEVPAGAAAACEPVQGIRDRPLGCCMELKAHFTPSHPAPPTSPPRPSAPLDFDTVGGQARQLAERWVGEVEVPAWAGGALIHQVHLGGRKEGRHSWQLELAPKAAVAAVTMACKGGCSLPPRHQVCHLSATTSDSAVQLPSTDQSPYLHPFVLHSAPVVDAARHGAAPTLPAAVPAGSGKRWEGR